jgi:hypothetical protein
LVGEEKLLSEKRESEKTSCWCNWSSRENEKKGEKQNRRHGKIGF